METFKVMKKPWMSSTSCIWIKILWGLLIAVCFVLFWVFWALSFDPEFLESAESLESRIFCNLEPESWSINKLLGFNISHLKMLFPITNYAVEFYYLAIFSGPGRLSNPNTLPECFCSICFGFFIEKENCKGNFGFVNPCWSGQNREIDKF